MFRRIFSFSNVTLFVALALSTIAAWYSIIGLTAIFAGAVVPIIIMGSVLELGKVVTTVWLRKYWHRCSLALKIYLVPAVILLAFLTSMGIFGFLSKAHTDQNLISGDVQSKIAIYDEKIKTAKENIEANRKQLKQMDEAVDQVMARSTTEEGATKANNIRKSQQRDRIALAKDIEANQKLIAKLNDESAPIRAEVRKVEAEVGPIKYIAAFIYGDNPDANLLERAVRWVIIILVIVFDPLALMLVIAANQSREWDKEESEHTPIYVADVGEKPTAEEIAAYEEDDGPLTDDQIAQIKKSVDPHPPGWMFDDPGEHPKDTLPQEEIVVEEPIKEEKSVIEQHAYLNKPFVHFSDMKPMVYTAEEYKQEITETQIEEKTQEPQIQAFGIDVIDRPGDYLTDSKNIPEIIDVSIGEDKEPTPNYEGVKVNGEWVQTGPAFVEIDKPVVTGDYVEYNNQYMHKDVFATKYPNLFLEVDDLNTPTASFGTQFPNKANTGDTFVRVDVYPNQVYKFNGARWLEKPREVSDVHLTDDYIQFLISKLAVGEYDPELLTPNEQDAIEQYIKNHKG